MDSLATTLLFAVILLGQVRLFCGVILRKCVNIHTTLSDIVILPPWVILLTYIILRVRIFSSTVVVSFQETMTQSIVSFIVSLNEQTWQIGWWNYLHNISRFCLKFSYGQWDNRSQKLEVKSWLNIPVVHFNLMLHAKVEHSSGLELTKELIKFHPHVNATPYGISIVSTCILQWKWLYYII